MARRPHSRIPLRLRAYTDLLRQRRAAAKYAPADPSTSRVYRRLKETSLSDRIFHTLRKNRRYHHAKPASASHLSLRLRAKHRRRWNRKGLTALCLSIGIGSATWLSLFVTEQVTLGGVPYRIVETFWNDDAARTAYFSGDAQALHDRLSALGVEEDIKAFYRDQFSNEDELDRYIHQVMFDRTGYVGEAYKVNNQGQLY